MANVKAYREQKTFSNAVEMVSVTYDFAVDGGATGALNLLKVTEASVLVDAFTKVDTTFTSGGSATLIIGRTGDTDGILASTAVASITAGTVFPGDAACKQVKLASGDFILMTIGTAAMTAGKMRVVVFIHKF
jgi:hypothetical protein